jgi:hypothetical protein
MLWDMPAASGLACNQYTVFKVSNELMFAKLARNDG